MKNKLWEDIVVRTRNEIKKRFVEIYASLDFGAYIAPENYFVSYIFQTDEELDKAHRNGLLREINDCHKKSLYEYGYPVEAIKDCTFASQEECEKRFGGNWYYYYK